MRVAGMSVMLTGLATWGAAALVVPAPLAARILLLAPLVVVPRLLALLPMRGQLSRLSGWPALADASPLVVAFSLQPGPLAAVFVVPWLALALTAATMAALHGLRNLPSILHFRRLADLGVDAAVTFWAVGASFLAVDRLGIDTGFSPAIVLLTAVQFHFAGFGLLALASLLAASRPALGVPVAGLVVGIPLTAVGFVLASDALNAIGATVVGISGIGVAFGLLAHRTRGLASWGLRAAGAALVVGVPMGIGWSLAILLGQPFLDLDAMVRTHGVLNATAVVLGVASHRAGGA